MPAVAAIASAAAITPVSRLRLRNREKLHERVVRTCQSLIKTRSSRTPRSEHRPR
jgi:hypothetical protein